VLARTALEAVAKETDPKAFKEDASDADLRKLVIKARLPSLTLDGKDEVYLAAAFDAARATKVTPAATTAPFPKKDEVTQDAADPQAKSKAAFKAQLERNANRWKGTPAK
jgi:hypothetical protein